MGTSKPSQPINGGNYYTTTATASGGSLTATTFRTNSSGGAGVPVSTAVTDANGKTTRTPGSAATKAETDAFGKKGSPEAQAVNAQIVDAKPYGTNPTDAQQKQINAAAGTPNKATINTPTGDGTSGATPPATAEQAAAAGKEAESYKTHTRFGDNAYGSLKYPENLAETHQDTVRFSILEYSPSLSKSKNNQQGTGAQLGGGKKRIVTLKSSGIPIVEGSKRIGVITLPIPAGISDGNNVGWQDDKLSQLQEEAVKTADAFFTGGADAAGKSLTKSSEEAAAAGKSGELGTAIKSIFGSAAAGGANVAGRAYGAAFNNNLELLFSTPSLRTFSFQFLFYPRSGKEAVMVRKIIRAFKQSMSVKRSESSLLLKAPHTFAISYCTTKDGKIVQHPYLNSFKECALTSCSVDYTPDGTYMTYGGIDETTGQKEPSMTAYRLSLTFQELEPIFDDEYYDIDNNKDTSIGF